MKFKFLKINIPENIKRVKVDTEAAYLASLKKEIDFEFFDNFIIVDYHWADSIINFGIKNTQSVVNSLYENFKNDFHKMIFINQHISCDQINWHSGIVFSCHANNNNNFISIPHIPKVYFQGNKKQEFEYFLSFVGSYETHNVRKTLSKSELPENSLFIDTGGWHFYNRDKKREERYKEVLSKSLFSLCPRGTGHGTIRLFESLRSGCIPVILSDGYKLPVGLKENENCIVIKEKDALKIKEILSNISNEEINSLIENVDKYSKKYLKEEIYNSVIQSLEENYVIQS